MFGLPNVPLDYLEKRLSGRFGRVGRLLSDLALLAIPVTIVGAAVWMLIQVVKAAHGTYLTISKSLPLTMSEYITLPLILLALPLMFYAVTLGLSQLISKSVPVRVAVREQQVREALQRMSEISNLPPEAQAIIDEIVPPSEGR